MADSEAMCTVVVSLLPEAPVPLLLLGVRDEFTGRPWQPPARHWAATEWAPLIVTSREVQQERRVVADFMVGHDGTPYAVRFVQ